MIVACGVVCDVATLVVISIVVTCVPIRVLHLYVVVGAVHNVIMLRILS